MSAHESRRAIGLDGAVDGQDWLALGDAALLEARFEDAEQLYRTALRAGGVSADTADRLERAAAGAAADLASEEGQAKVFEDRLERVSHEGGFDASPPLDPPPSPRRPSTDRLHGVKVWTGRAAGSLGSTVFRLLTDLAGRRGVHEETWTNWYSSGRSLPGPTARWYRILKLAYMRETLFANNLVRPYPEGSTTGYADSNLEPPAWARRWRSADGTWNDLHRDAHGRYDPMVGAAYTRFFRNVGDDRGLAGLQARPDPAVDPVSVRELSRRLLTPRGARREIESLNLWAGAWIQFQNNDWVSHGTPDADHVDRIPLADDDPLRRYGIEHLEVRATVADPTRRTDDAGLPATFLNEVTHWWDGSQLYGSDWGTQERVRSGVGGRLRLGADGILPVDDETGSELAGFSRNWWVGLGLLHTLFTREHNAICTELAKANPTWDDEALFQTARLVNAAVMAKIHTVEWTPAILPNHALRDAMSTNWFGLLTNIFGGERKRVLEEIPISSRELGGIVGNPQATFARYGLSEEFTAVYRMHSLLPDELHVVSLDGRSKGSVSLARSRNRGSPALIAEHGVDALARSFGEQSPCALVNNNYPVSMQDFSAPGAPVMDLGAIDLYRDRERGVPTYNQLRRELGLPPVRSFRDLTDDARCVSDLRELYGVDGAGCDNVDDIDLLIGTLSESHRPDGFGFGETLFQIFILNASWRLLGDRFYTDDFREEVYTAEGLGWVDDATMKGVLLRNMPALADTGLANVDNAFEPWDEGPLDPARHPLRTFGP